jgi:hypothetical protein
VADEEPTLAQKAISYGSALALAAIVGAAGGFFVYTRLAVGGRRQTSELTQLARTDWSVFYACVGGGVAVAVLFVVGALTWSDPPKRR